MAKKIIELPCDVGDTVYMITNYVSGRKLLDRAIIMRLTSTVKSG